MKRNLYKTTVILLLALSAVMIQSGCRLFVVTGAGGTVQGDSGEICDPVCVYSVSAEFIKTFTATPAPGFEFHSWSAGSCPTNVCVVTIPGQFLNVVNSIIYTANFRPIQNDCTNVAGVWNFGISNIDSEFCNDDDEPDYNSIMTITQQGCSLTITGIKDDPQTLIGNVVGNTVTIGHAAFPDGEGTTVSRFIYDLSNGSGLESWTWSDEEGFSCGDGTATVTVTPYQ